MDSRPSVAGVGRAGFIRDPSGLLMSIIQSLASSDDDRQREHEKERLEEAFSGNDEKLHEMVEANYEELARTIKRFGKIGERISESRSRVKHVKENLLQCKSLLHCRQDELRKLWMEGVEHKKVLQLLDEVEEVKSAPDNIEQFMKQKYYLHATKLILKTLDSLTNNLIKVEALHDIRTELLSRKVLMHEGFINELHRQLYFNSIKVSAETGPAIDSDDLDIVEDLTKDPDKDPFRLMTVLVMSLALLGRIPDAIEAIEVRMDRHINMIVTHTSIEVTDLFYHKESEKEDPKRLLELLELLFSKFRCVVNAHKHILSLIDKNSHNIHTAGAGKMRLYSIEDVWSKIQSVMQLLLQEYLDVDNAANTTQQMVGIGFSEVHSSSFASHFSRKRTPRPRVAKLFRFEASSHAISMNTYLREQRAEQRISAGNRETSAQEIVDHNITAQKVCKPNSRNITLVFGPLNTFVKEIETELHYADGKKCSLNEFITEYIENIFIRQVQYEMKKSFDSSSKVTDPLKALADVSTQKITASCTSLLQSTVVVDQCLWDLYTLMNNLCGYHDQFLAMACSVLHEYKETLIQSYRGVVQPESEDQRIVSASWVREIEVTHLLTSLESWRLVQSDKTPSQDKYSRQLLADFHKEAQYFVSKLGDDTVQRNGIVEDVNDLAAIANLHESLEWFVGRLTLLLSKIKSTAPKDTMLMLNQLWKDFNNMCEICLFCLHIEVRVHCFYYLVPMFKTSSYDIRTVDSMERDPMVLQLAKDISAMDEVLSSTLQPRKMRYIFEGMGHLNSAIMIHCAKYISRITHSGIKRMCRNIFVLQQVLTHATVSRDSHLDAARVYYEMLYHSPDDLQSIVVEQGVQFEEEYYVQAVELLHRSRPGSGDDWTKSARVQRLRELVREQIQKNEQAENGNQLEEH